MPKDKNASDSARIPAVKGPFRTYSRHGRAMKRSFTSLPEHVSRSADLTNPNSKRGRHRLTELAMSGHKGMRINKPLEKTLTDVFWEHLSSSAPEFSRSQETDRAELSISIKTDQVACAASVEEKTNSAGVGDVLAAKHGRQRTKIFLGQRARDSLCEAIVREDVRDDETNSEERSNDGEASQLGLLDDTGFTPSPKPRIKRGSLLCFSSPADPRTKKTRRLLDVDEALSVVEATSAGTKPLSVTATTTAPHKENGHQEFRQLNFAKKPKFKRSSDGFERSEARAAISDKRRRIVSSDLSIGPLEITQKGVAIQKLHGPTWSRGQKKPRVARTTSPWSRRQYFSSSQFQIDTEETNAAVQVKQSESAHRAPRARTKHRISHLMPDDEEEPMSIPDIRVLTNEQDTHSNGDAEVVSTSLAQYDKHALYISDAQESVDLLVPPVDNENEASMVIVPATTTPQNDAEVEKEVDGRLPPKRWTFNVLDYEEDLLTLRPTLREWTRVVTISDTFTRE